MERHKQTLKKKARQQRNRKRQIDGEKQQGKRKEEAKETAQARRGTVVESGIAKDACLLGAVDRHGKE